MAGLELSIKYMLRYLKKNGLTKNKEISGHKFNLFSFMHRKIYYENTSNVSGMHMFFPKLMK